MLKGLAALFSTGVILNPMVLLGILTGLLFAVKLDYEQMSEIYHNYHFYLLALFLAAFYNIFFKKVYKNGGRRLDTTAMSVNIIFSTIKFIASNALTIAFVVMIAF